MQPTEPQHTSPFDLHGKLAVVTGVRRGIGLAVAEALAGAGADIVGISRQLEPDGGRAGRLVEARGRRRYQSPPTLATVPPYRVCSSALPKYGRPVADSLIGNAGTIYREPAGAHDVEQWDRVLEVNLTSQFLLAQALGPEDGEPRLRQGHLHSFDAQLSGRHQCCVLHREQAWGRRSDKGFGE